MSGHSGTNDEFTRELARIVGSQGLRDAASIAGLDPGVSAENLRAAWMARPADAGEVARVLALCARHGVPVVPQGGRTGLSGGAHTQRGDLILSLDRLNTIEEIDPASRTVIAGAGVTLERLDEALAPLGLAAGIDLGARGTATIGGMASTNAGGIDAFRRGTMRGRILGLEVALADGTVLRDLSRVLKDNSGIPLRQLFIGSEGTLGVITRVALALVPSRRAPHVALALVGTLADAIAVMRRVEGDGRVALTAAELMSANHIEVTAAALDVHGLTRIAPARFGLLLSVEARVGDGTAALEEILGSAVEDGSLRDAVLPKNATEERDLWRVREDWAVDRLHPGGLWYDVSVPVGALSDYLDDLQARLAAHDSSLSMYVVGHLGDGNVHVTVNAAVPLTGRYAEVAAIVYAGLRDLGGSFSAEHGIGLEKRASLETWAGPAAIDLMRSVKAVFDPHDILNPGKVVGPARRP